MVHVRIKLLLTTGKRKKIIRGEKPTVASLGSAIKKDNGWIVFPALGNFAVPNLEATLCLFLFLSLKHDLLETLPDLWGQGRGQRAGSKMKHLVNEGNCSAWWPESFLCNPGSQERRLQELRAPAAFALGNAVVKAVGGS